MIEERTEDKQIEVIAEKSRAAAYAYIALFAVGVLIAAAGIFLFIKYAHTVDAVLTVIKITLTAVGGVLAIVFGGLFLSQLYKQFALVKLIDGAVEFFDGTKCRPDEIEGVRADNAKILTVTVSGRNIEVKGVANIEKAYKKLALLAGKDTEINNG